MGPAARMWGSFVRWSLSITSLLSNTRHASFTADERERTEDTGIEREREVCVPVNTVLLTSFSPM